MTSLLAPALGRAQSAFDADPTSRSAAHLAEYSFRFAPDEPAAVPAPPSEDGPWTLDQTLRELRRRDLSVDRTSRGLHVRHGWRVPALADAVRQHEVAVTAWLDLGRPAPTRDWDDETTLHVAWLRAQPRPASPVALHAGVTISDWPRFVDSVEGRMAAGPQVRGADSLRRDLAALFARLATPAPVHSLGRRPARAA